MSHDPKFDAPEVSPHRPYLSELCNECGKEVWDNEDDAGPSCGAHVLHIDCGPYFGCTYCYEIRAEIP